MDSGRAFDRFWTRFQMRAHPVDPLRYALRLALDWQLHPRPTLKAIRAAFRGFGPQGVTVRLQNMLFDALLKVMLGPLRPLVQFCKARCSAAVLRSIGQWLSPASD